MSRLYDDNTEVIPDIKLDINQNDLIERKFIRMRSYFNNFIEQSNDNIDSNQSNVNQNGIFNQNGALNMSSNYQLEQKREPFTLYYRIKIDHIYNNRIELLVTCYYDNFKDDIIPEKHTFTYIWYFNTNYFTIRNIKSVNCKLIVPNLTYLNIYIQIINEYLFEYPPSLID
jgi:hypothetical protein